MKIIINKDIRDYKVKDVGPFTLGQTFSLLIAIILAYGVVYLTKRYWGWSIMENDAELLIVLIVSAIPLSFGFIKVCGLSLKDYLITLLFENIISPKLRIYVSDFDYSQMEEVPDETDNVKTQKKYTKEELNEIKRWKGYK